MAPGQSSSNRPIRVLDGALVRVHTDSGSGPFRGLLAFSEDDAPWFFGREREVAALEQRKLEIDAHEVRLAPDLRDFDTRSAALLEVSRTLADHGVTPPVMGEPYAVTPGGRDEALCVVDRGAAAYFGVCSFGQHLNGFVRRDDGIYMWLGRRSRDRLLFPGALDNMVAGGLPHGPGHADRAPRGAQCCQRRVPRATGVR